MKPAAEERPTVEVTREDQDDINAYALLVQRRSEQVEALAVRSSFVFSSCFFSPHSGALGCAVWVLCWGCPLDCGCSGGSVWVLRPRLYCERAVVVVLTHTYALRVSGCSALPILLLLCLGTRCPGGDLRSA